MRPCDQLRAAAIVSWEAMQTHRFVQDIEADRLPPGVFARYLGYERAFVETAILIFGQALLRAPGLASRRRLCSILQGLAGPQLAYFDRSLAALGLPQQSSTLPSAVASFCDGTRAIAETGSYSTILAMMLAAEWTYATWCVRANAKPASDPLIADWVRLHTEADFLDQVAWLQGEVDAALATDPSSVSVATRTFATMLALETDFHSAAYEDASSDRGGASAA